MKDEKKESKQDENEDQISKVAVQFTELTHSVSSSIILCSQKSKYP